MFKPKGRIVIGLVGLSFLVALMLFGCDAGIKGTQRPNSPPTIEFANVPPDSTPFSVTPEISWWGTDRDGSIAKYQYAVVIADSIVSLWGGVSEACESLALIHPDIWVDSLQGMDPKTTFISAVETEASVVNVQLFAGDNVIDTIVQYFFVKAVDDDTASSKVIRRMFSRNNHRPDAYINSSPFYDGDNKMIPRYCLPKTTDTWKGIRLTWEGADSIDHPTNPPPFFFKWELYGPFANTSVNPLDEAELSDSAGVGRLVLRSFDEDDTTDPYVEDKSLLIAGGLVNYPNTTPNLVPDYLPYNDADLGFGLYLFKVWAVDDAFSLSDPPAYMWFKIIHPLMGYQIARKILVLDLGMYPEAGSHKSNSVVSGFYNRALGSLVSKDSIDIFAYKSGNVEVNCSRDVLSKYNLVLSLNNSSKDNALLAEAAPHLKEYLKVGGKVWAIGYGSSTFGVNIGGGDEFVPFSDISYAKVYFGLAGMYNAGWVSSSPKQEFVGVDIFDNSEISGLPNLRTDSAKVADWIDWDDVPDSVNVDSIAPRLPMVGYTHVGYSEKIYSFASADSGTSGIHTRPIASVFKGPPDPDGKPIFRTAHFGFCIEYIPEEDAGDVAKRDSLFEAMVGWFWED